MTEVGSSTRRARFEPARPRQEQRGPDWRVVASHHLDRWLAVPMLVLSVAFLPVLLIPEADRHLSHGVRSAFEVADWAIWAAFAVEYLLG